jgi:hypothetical protein
VFKILRSFADRCRYSLSFAKLSEGKNMRGKSNFTKGQQDAIRVAKEVGASKVEFELPKGGKMTVFLDNQEVGDDPENILQQLK